jgi:hypothetical protein
MFIREEQPIVSLKTRGMKILRELRDLVKERNDEFEIHMDDYYGVMNLDYYIKDTALTIHNNGSNDEFNYKVKDDDKDGTKAIYYVKFLKTKFRELVYTLMDEYFVDTDEYLNFIYSKRGSRQYYIKRNDLFLPLFDMHLGLTEGDVIPYNRQNLLSKDATLFKLFSVIFSSNMGTDFIRLRNSQSQVPLSSDLGDEFIQNNQFILKKIEGVPTIIANITNLSTDIPYERRSVLFLFPVVYSYFECMNNFAYGEQRLEARMFRDQLISYNLISQNMVRQTRETVFERELISYILCSISQIPIPQSIYFDVLSGLRMTHKILIDNNGDLCYLEAFKTKDFYDRFKVKKGNVDGYSYYSYNEKSEDNLKKRISEYKNYQPKYTQINGYGASNSHNIFLNDNESQAESEKELYLGVEMEFDGGGQSHENHHLFISALTNYEPFAWTTRDGSLNNGFETKTVPATIKNHMNRELFDYPKAFEVLKTLGYSSSDSTTCGLHIHISVSHFLYGVSGRRFNLDKLRLFTQFVLTTLLEQNWKSFLTFTRRKNEEVERWARRGNFFQDFNLKEQLQDFSYNSYSNLMQKYYDTDYKRTKYSAINNNRGATFEYRIFKGTLNPIANYASMQIVYNMSKIVRDLIEKHFINAETLDYKELGNDLIKTFSMNLTDIANYHPWEELTEYINNITKYMKDK